MLFLQQQVCELPLNYLWIFELPLDSFDISWNIKNSLPGGTRLALSIVHETLNCRVMSTSPMLSIDIYNLIILLYIMLYIIYIYYIYILNSLHEGEYLTDIQNAEELLDSIWLF